MRNKTNKTRYIFLILTVLVAVVIFYMSSRDATESADMSGAVATDIFGRLLGLFGVDLNDPETFSVVDHIIRKLAHFSEYAVLGVCMTICVKTFDKPNYFTVILTLTSCFLYACSDEFHQYFVPGRSMQFTDAMIDTAGAATGTAISALILAIIQHRNTKRKTDNSNS